MQNNIVTYKKCTNLTTINTHLLGSQRVDYSELVRALQSQQKGEANSLLKKLTPVLCKYLEIVMDANPEDAKDAVQEALLRAYKKIVEEKIEDEQYIYKYFLTTCRHTYLRLIRKDHHFVESPEDYSGLMLAPQQQIENLLDKDRQKILQACLQKLQKKSRTFIIYMMNNPDATTKGLSERFGLTESNVRVKKMRIMDDLSYCVKKKWDT